MGRLIKEGFCHVLSLCDYQPNFDGIFCEECWYVQEVYIFESDAKRAELQENFRRFSSGYLLLLEYCNAIEDRLHNVSVAEFDRRLREMFGVDFDFRGQAIPNTITVEQTKNMLDMLFLPFAKYDTVEVH